MTEDHNNGQYLIPEQNLAAFNAAISRLSKKAVKLVGETIETVVFGYEMKDNGKGGTNKFYNVLMSGPKVGLAGWSFVALLENSKKTNKAGNIVRVMPGKTLPEVYRQADNKCDHCNIKRYRRDTYVVQNDTTLEFKQVGSSCLEDFTQSKSADKIAKLAELMVHTAGVAWGYTTPQGRSKAYIGLHDYLACVARVVEKQGHYVSKVQALKENIGSTAWHARTMYYQQLEILASENYELANKAIEWAQALDSNSSDFNDYKHNLKVIANSPFIEDRATNYAASLLGTYLRSLAPASAPVVTPPSVFIGQAGEKLEVSVTVLTAKEVESQYGVSWLITMVTDEGNNVKTFASKKIAKPGDKVQLQGTVKKHETYRNVNITVLTRCKVV